MAAQLWSEEVSCGRKERCSLRHLSLRGQIISVQNNRQEELSIVPPKLVIFLQWVKISGLIHISFQLWAGDYMISQALSRKQKAPPPGKGLQV